MTDYALNRAARALNEVLRARRPDLSWEVTIREKGDPPPAPTILGPVTLLLSRAETP